MDVLAAAGADLDRLGDESRERRNAGAWRWIAGIEVLLCAAAVILDLLIPTIVMLLLLAVSLLLRRERPSSIGFHRVARPGRMAAIVLGAAVAWTAMEVLLLIPSLEHLTGQRQVTTDFTALQGDVGMLMLLLAVSWTLAAVGEEAAYRGYLLTRLTDALGAGRAGAVAAVVISSALFGLAHTEQGLIGVLLSAIDGVFFAVLRLHFRTLWASVLAHGFSNTLGLVAFFLVGQVPSPW
jgi:membrane protease YdiL (CAAX protease family)